MTACSFPLTSDPMSSDTFMVDIKESLKRARMQHPGLVARNLDRNWDLVHNCVMCERTERAHRTDETNRVPRTPMVKSSRRPLPVWDKTVSPHHWLLLERQKYTVTGNVTTADTVATMRIQPTQHPRCPDDRQRPPIQLCRFPKLCFSLGFRTHNLVSPIPTVQWGVGESRRDNPDATEEIWCRIPGPPYLQEYSAPQWIFNVSTQHGEEPQDESPLPPRWALTLPCPKPLVEKDHNDWASGRLTGYQSQPRDWGARRTGHHCWTMSTRHSKKTVRNPRRCIEECWMSDKRHVFDTIDYTIDTRD